MKHRLASLGLLTLAAAAFGIVAIVIFSYALERGQVFAEGSSSRSTRDGLRAFALLLEAQGFKVTQLDNAWDLKNRKGVLLSIAGPRRKAEQAGRIRRQDLWDWVSKGNTAVLFCPFENEYLDDLGVSWIKSELTAAKAQPGAPLTEQASEISVRAAGYFKGGRSTTLYANGTQPVAVRIDRGTGHVVLIADVYLASNVGIVEADNALFLLNVAETARGAEVVFDETSSRLLFGEPGVMAYVRKVGAHTIFLELLILCALAMWYLGGRVGPAVSARAPEPRASADFVTGCAMLYEKALMGRAIVKILCDSLRDQVRRTQTLSPNARSRYEGLLRRGDQLARVRRVKDSELVVFFQSVHDFENEVLWKRQGSPSAPLTPR